jgi:F420-0:gamma-glutamyl ligase
VSDVFVVTEAVLIASEKVTEMVELLETEVAESAGEVDETVGLVPSVTRVMLSEVTTETFPAESLYQA